MLKMFEAGNPITVVAEHHGLVTSTFHDWMQRSDEASEAEDHESPFFGFSDRVRASRARAQEKALKIVWDAVKGGRKVKKTVTKEVILARRAPDRDWSPFEKEYPTFPDDVDVEDKLISKEVTTTEYETLPNTQLAVWYLERTNRPDFGRTVGLTGGDGVGPVRIERVDPRKLTDDELDQLEAIFEEADGRATPDAGGGPSGEDA